MSPCWTFRTLDQKKPWDWRRAMWKFSRPVHLCGSRGGAGAPCHLSHATLYKAKAPPQKKQQQSHRLLRKEWNNWKELIIVKTFGNPPSVFHSLWLVGQTHHAGPWTGPCPTSMLTASDADLALPELLWTLRSSVAAVEVRIDLLRKTWPRAPPEWLPEEVGVKF